MTTVKKRTTFVAPVVAPPGEDPAADLFDRPPRAVALAPSATSRITCRVCRRPAAIPLGALGLLCDLCREDLGEATKHVQAIQWAAGKRLRQQWEAFDAHLAAADQATRERWAKVEAARVRWAAGKLTAERFQGAWSDAKAQEGAFAALLAAYEALEAVSVDVSERQEQARCAMEEIAAARQG